MYVSRLIEYLYVQGWCDVSVEGFVYSGLALDFSTKGHGFYFYSGKKNHFKCQFSEEGNQCALSPSGSSVWKHASTYAL